MSMSSDKDVLNQLDETVSAIERHRDWRAKQTADEEGQLDQAWQSVISAAKKLREKLRGNPGLRYFSIARDESQVAVSFRQSGAGSNLLTLYRRHPEDKYPTTMAIWCREEGRADRRFTSGAESVECLVRHCAANLVGKKAQPAAETEPAPQPKPPSVDFEL